MSTIPRRIASTFAVLCGRYGDVTHNPRAATDPAESLYREAEKVVQAVDGTAAEARVEELRRRLADQEAENRSLRRRLERAVEISRDTQDEFASVARPRGSASVSLAGSCKSWPDGATGSRASPRSGTGDPRGRPAHRSCSRSSTRRPGPASSRPPPMRISCLSRFSGSPAIAPE